MPSLSRLEANGARFALDHGIEKHTGLAWEQFATGRMPEEAGRWSAIRLDIRRYRPEQPPTRLPPFPETLDRRTVVFDPPYYDLGQAGRSRGVVAWGAHDPGVAASSRPMELGAEIAARFGPYPADDYIYALVWPSAARTARMATALVDAVRTRGRVAEWLFGERLPDWDLGVAVLSEFHSAAEALWHGIDPDHPLHDHPSAAPARDGLIGTYVEADRMIGRLAERFSNADLLLFSPHGMGRNRSDIAAMCLLPELLYRHFTGRTALSPAPDWQVDGSAGPDFTATAHWAEEVARRMAVEPSRHGLLGRLLGNRTVLPLDWMPATRYRPHWPRMAAFALPAYYDGRMRVNLRGRELRGRVAPGEYPALLDAIRTLVAECRDAASGRPVQATVEVRPGDPAERHPTDADLIFRFVEDHYGWVHPRLGRIGPVPCRRPGGHTGGMGYGLYVKREARDAGRDLGVFPTGDMSTAVAALLGQPAGTGTLGHALARPPCRRTAA